MKKKGKVALFIILGILVIIAVFGIVLRFAGVEPQRGMPKKSVPSPAQGETAALARTRRLTGGRSGLGPSGARDQAVFPVNVSPAVYRRLENYIKLNGDVAAETTIYVYPDISGKVTDITVRVGEAVKEGQTVAVVDPSKPGSRYAKSPVTASISGIVTAIPVMHGAAVSSSVPIVELGSLERLRVETFVPERFVGKIKVGRSALLSFDAYPGLTFQARVAEMSPALDPVSRSMEIKLEFDDPKRQVKAGMFAEIRLVTEVRSNALTVPADSVINRGGRQVVFVLEGSNATEREVVSGISVDGMTEIVSGLSVDEMVVIRGQTLLDDGAKVRVVEGGKSSTDGTGQGGGE
ncbi:MAG: efflux RND transporter periplasmic adaptor subunit [Spirochaetes bacterium]|nr:efflux RND transporter periplasmic adaptor subunit [Spirochaetota bacterium]